MLLKQKKISICIGMLLGSILISGGAQAQIAPPPDYDQKLADMVVTATKSGTTLRDMTQNTTILTKEELEIAPEQTIDQVLKNQTSVFLNDQPYYEKDPTGQSINVRGLGNARTLVLIDGVPANDAMYGTVQWNLVPMSAIQDVEFIRGGVSSLYGNMGMGGVINITTKPISDNKGEVSGSIGSYATGTAAVSKEFAISNSFKLRASADYFSTEGYQNIATIYPSSQSALKTGMGNQSAESANYRLQGSLKVSQDTDGFFNFGLHSMSNLPTGGYNFARKSTNETTISGGTTTRLNSSEQVQVNAFYENTTLQQQNVSSSNPYINATFHNPYYQVGGSAQYTNNFQNSLIDQMILSADVKQLSASNYQNNYASPGAANYQTSKLGALSSQVVSEGTQNFLGILGQAKSKLTAIPLQATLSARVDNWTSQIPVNYTQAAGGAQVSTAVPNQSKTKLSPNLGLLYRASRELDFRAAAYQAFHAPGLNNSIRSYGSGSSYVSNNPFLTPENMTGYEMGSDYRWKSGFIQVTGFNANVTNAIATYTMTSSQIASTCAPVCSSGAKSYSNDQSLRSTGLELQARYDISSKWATDLGYTLTKAVLTSTYGAIDKTLNPTGVQIAGTPRNMGSASLTYFPIPKASLTASVRYIGNSWYDTAHTSPIPAYAVVGARANYEVTPNATVYLSAVNLLNRNFITFGSGSQYTAGQPQTITVGGRITF
ncbi:MULTISPECIES: TonB-dependent receptor [unclassified Polynucleobacter]|uniref:TonB-dependent receptor n=1 Tax=unclassified Polynucleobacter TaxID=2640945 RepID=UPI001BFDE200|nr:MULTISPECIES: TonB-dependent receptor [unclassified Polynucleobacter]MBU3558642.1 TonB-dependent receptor [Polynucleobacter sp. Nonnen-W13]QWE31316.1 TonB-dependent receptor [Polynucleobacter sp. Adler-ghost]